MAGPRDRAPWYQGVRSSAGGWTSEQEELSVPRVAALVDQELDAGRCSGPSLNLLTTFQYWVLDFVSTFHYLRPDFSSTFLVFGVSRAQLPLEKADNFRSFPGGKF